MNRAATKWSNANKDLLSDYVIRNLLVSVERDMLSKSIPDDWDQFYSVIGNEVRQRLGSRAPTPTQALQTPQSGHNPSDLDAKLSRKDNIVNLPTAAARVAAPEPDKPLSREDRLNQLRTARGQPVG